MTDNHPDRCAADEQLRAEAESLRCRLIEEARRLDATELIAYLQDDAETFIAAYLDAQNDPGKVVSVSPFLYTLT